MDSVITERNKDMMDEGLLEIAERNRDMKKLLGIAEKNKGMIECQATMRGQELGLVTSEAIDQIKHRINSTFGPVNYRMSVLCHPNKWDYLFDYFAPKIVWIDNFPLDIVFVVCESVNGRQIVHLPDTKDTNSFERIDWAGYANRMWSYILGKSDNKPELIIDIPGLQAVINVSGYEQDERQRIT